MADEVKTIRIIVDASRAVDGSAAATRALQNIEQATTGAASVLTRMQAKITELGTIIKADFVSRLIEVGLKLYEIGKAAISSAADLGELAAQMGITTAGLQGLQLAAVQNRMTVEELQVGVAKFSQKMGEAAGGSKTMIDALNGIGVKILDVNGKLVPTEKLLQDVAVAILKIDDPAKQIAASVDFFGKAGSRTIPMLKELAEGLGAMGEKAKRAGAFISDDVIEKLDKLADRAEVAKLRTRALFAENLAGPLTAAFDWMTGRLENLSRLAKALRTDFISMALFLASPGAYIASAMQATPQEKVDSDRTGLNTKIAEAKDRIDRDAARGMPRPADARLIAGWQKDLNDVNFRQMQIDAARDKQIGNPSDPDGIGIRITPKPGGVKQATSTEDAKAAENLAEKIRKVTMELTAAAQAQDEMTDAARKGDVQFVAQESHLQALQKAIDMYGGKLAATAPEVVALTKKFEEQIRTAKEGKLAETFVVATTELEKQNVILTAQNALMNEAPEIQARELAIIKAKQEAEKAGGKITEDDIARRRAAVEQNELLKSQAEQMRQTNELWTEPLKQALRNIQTAGADMWDTILEKGNFSMQSMVDALKVTVRRMAAEFLALATIRPVMSLMVQAIGPSGIGLIGGNTVNQLGFGGSGGSVLTGGGGSPLSGGGGGAGSLGSLGGGGMFSGGGMFGDTFSGISSFLNTPFTGGFSGIAPLPQGVMGPAPNTIGGGLGASGWSMGGMTPGSVLGGGLSIGMGALSLAQANGNTAKTIGGVGQMIGGALMMIPTPYTMAAGAIISMASSILPSLFGDDKKTPPQPALAYGQGNFYATGGTSYSSGGDSLGSGSSLAGAGSSVGAQVMKLFQMAGVTPVAGQLIGGELAGGTDHQLNGGQWTDRPYTQVGLVNPNGSLERLSYNDSSRNMQQAGDFLLGQVFRANVLRGGVSGAGAGLTAAARGLGDGTTDSITKTIQLGAAYDALGKAANPVKEAIDKVTASFGELTDFASNANLALGPINDELAKQTKRVAQDFIDGMLDPVQVQLRALADERASAMESAQYIKEHVTGVYVDMDRIATFYTNKEAALRDQFYQGAVTNLQNLISRLTYGDLGNASPTLNLSGVKASYTSTLAQARAGSSTAITNLPGMAEAYATSARNYFASGPEYAAIVAQMRRDLEEQAALLTGGAAATGTSTTAALSAVAQSSQTQIAQLTAMVENMANDNAQQREMMAALVAQLRAQNTHRI
jgi:hypothetical protein